MYPEMNKQPTPVDERLHNLTNDVMNMFRSLPFDGQIEFYRSIKNGFIQDREIIIKETLAEREQVSSKIEFLNQGLKSLQE